MRPLSPSSLRRRGRPLLLAATAAGGLLLSACGSAPGGSAGASGSPGPSEDAYSACLTHHGAGAGSKASEEVVVHAALACATPVAQDAVPAAGPLEQAYLDCLAAHGAPAVRPSVTPDPAEIPGDDGGTVLADTPAPSSVGDSTLDAARNACAAARRDAAIAARGPRHSPTP